MRQTFICCASGLLFTRGHSAGTYCKLLRCVSLYWEFKALLSWGWWMEGQKVKRKCKFDFFYFFFYGGLSERIQGCSACRSGLGSHDKHVALASVIRNTRLVFGSFSARYILERTHGHTHTVSTVHLWCLGIMHMQIMQIIHNGLHLHKERVYADTHRYMCSSAHMYTVIPPLSSWD